MSTILFAIKGCHHTIVPDPAQVTRIVDWCDQDGISTERLNFIVERSEIPLPTLDFSNPISLYLIDGAHGFPIPFLDWYYVYPHLEEGGLVVVDDVQIWTGRVLRQFLEKEDNWEIVRSEPLEFFASRLLRQSDAVEWNFQPYVLHRSVAPESTSLVRRSIGYGFAGYHMGSSGLGIIRRRDWPSFSTDQWPLDLTTKRNPRHCTSFAAQPFGIKSTPNTR